MENILCSNCGASLKESTEFCDSCGEWQGVSPVKENSEEELFVNINKTLLEWVIENICKNAVDAMQGKGKIKIVINQNDSTIQIIIKDTGKGINADKLNKILSENTGKSIKTIEKDTNRDNFLSSEAALEYGLIDQIVTSR